MKKRSEKTSMECGCDSTFTKKGGNKDNTRVCIFPPLVNGEPQPDSIEVFEFDMYRVKLNRF